MKRRFVIVGGIIVIVLVIVGVFGWQQMTASAAASTTHLQTTSVTRGTIVATVDAAGNVSAPTSATLAFASSGRVAKVAVQVGDSVKKGQLLMALDTTDLQLALQSAKTSLMSAQASYDATQASLQAAIKTAQSNVASAQANYDSAKAKDATNLDQVIVAKATLDQAKVTLDQAQGAYNAIAWRGDVSMTTQAATLQTATDDYNSALANYNIAVAGVNHTALQSAQASLDSAQVALDQAQKNLTTSTQTAQASLDSAQVAVEQAQRNLDAASLYAPFDGVISAVNFGVGDTASGTAVGIADLSNLQVNVSIDEVDIAKVAVGQTAQMTMDALPGKTYDAKVISIGPVGTITSGVVNYPVTVSITHPDAAVKPGMTANLSVKVEQRDNVLLVPNRAVRTQGNQKIVTVLYHGQTIATPVSTGLSNDTSVEITSGLREGDVVVLNQTQTQSRGGPGRIGFPLGGF